MSPQTPPKVSILIVGYNSADLIRDCIRSIATGSSQTDCEILLVDNGDGSTEALVRAEFPDVIIVESRGNIGFAAGNNLLADHASAPYLLLLNPDMILAPNAIDALVAGAMNHCDAAAWGGVTTDQDGKPDSGNAIAVPSLVEFVSVALGRSIVGHRRIDGIASDAKVKTLSGGFVMFDRKAWNEARGLDERYFLYCEEIDLFYRLAKRGHSIWRIAAARGHHKVGHGHGMSSRRLLYRAAGTAEFLRQHWSIPARLLAIFLIWVAAAERYLAGKLLGWRSPHLKSMSEGYRLVALRPSLWRSGYDPRKGLLVQLEQAKGGTG